MIIKKIYDGATAKDLNLSDIQYSSRRAILDKFLITWNGEDFEQEFLVWLRWYNGHELGAISGDCCGDKQEDTPEESDLTYGEMFSDLAVNIKSIVKSGIKIVDNEEHARRYKACLDCKYLQGARCIRCGCFMKVKSKFKAMNCPIGKW